MKETFAGKIRTAAKMLNHFSVGDLSNMIGVQTYAERGKIHDVISDMHQRREVARTGRGQYKYVGISHPPQKQAVMWRYLRSSRSFGGVTIDELREASGASEDYVQEWLNLLISREIVKRDKDRYQLLSDPLEMPQNDEKAERLREIRLKKREKVLKSLAYAKEAISEAEELLKEMNETAMKEATPD